MIPNLLPFSFFRIHLQNYPMKMGQFNRGNPAMANWMQQQQQQQHQGGMGMGGMPGGPGPTTKGSNKRGAANANMGSNVRNKVSSAGPSGPVPMMGSNCNNNNHHMFNNLGDCGMDGGGVMPDFPPEDISGAMASLAGASSSSLQGVKIPDENLTPEQMAHRQERIEKLRQIQMMLLPENAPGAGAGGGPPGGVPAGGGVSAQKSPINPTSSGPMSGMMMGTTTTTSSSMTGDCALSKNNSNSVGQPSVDCISGPVVMGGPGGNNNNNMLFSGGGPRGPSPHLQHQQQHQMPPGAMGPGPGWKRQHSMPSGMSGPPHGMGPGGGPGGMGMIGGPGMGPGGFPGPGPNFHGNGMANMHHMGHPQHQQQQPSFKGAAMQGIGGGLGPHQQQQHRMMMNGTGGPGGPGEMGIMQGPGSGGGIPPGGNGGLPPPYHQTQRSASVPMGGNSMQPQQHPATSPLHGGGGGMMSRGMSIGGGGGPQGGMPFHKDWPGNGPMDVNSNSNSIGKWRERMA